MNNGSGVWHGVYSLAVVARVSMQNENTLK
jgi:hypothetical protein